MDQEVRRIEGKHEPRCNELCDGDMHYLKGDGPERTEPVEQLPPGEHSDEFKEFEGHE